MVKGRGKSGRRRNQKGEGKKGKLPFGNTDKSDFFFFTWKFLINAQE